MTSILSLAYFWQYHPALFFSLSLLFGFYAIFYTPLIILIPLSVFWIPLTFQSHHTKSLYHARLALFSLILFISAVAYTYFHYQFPSLPTDGIKGTAYIQIQSLHTKISPFNQQWLYRCEISSFKSDDSNAIIAKHLPCSIVLPKKSTLIRPLAHQNYRVKGVLKLNDSGQYVLKVKTKDPWYPISGSWNLSEIRYQAKKSVKGWIQHHISDPQSALFLAGLATGEFDDKQLTYDFSRFGLQHVMAISGFHFAIIAAILSFFLRLIFPIKINALLIIFLLSGYFLFLGTSASILRSWSMISLAMIGFFLEKSPNALNLLGGALLITLLTDPLLSQTLGFQLSFLTTTAILLLHPIIDSFLVPILTKRSLSQIIPMNLVNQHAYVILALFRQGLALTLAVNLIALPALLYYFHQFPLLSLLYNFFFPFLVSLSMFFLIIGMVIPGVNALNTLYTQWVLQFTHQMPTSVDAYIRYESLPLWGVVTYVTLIFVMAIIYKERRGTAENFTFL
jgi:competence protein ComEC